MKNEKAFLRDVQNERDERNVPIDMVGIRGLKYPIVVLDRANGRQRTVGTFDLFVDLPRDFRGTHMSRFVEVLDRHNNRITPRNMESILKDMREFLKADVAHINVFFPYFLRKSAPVSGISSYSSFECGFITRLNEGFDFILEVNVPVMTVCPCSKEISDRGAHNQRANAKVRIRMNSLVWIEEIIEIAETSASAPIFSLLKREDEKFITELSYDNPRFVEDLSREIVLRLEKDPRITWYRVEVASQESIHNHEAYACIEKRGI
ncbi:GTP cyclohydrolase FolE2 [Kosmotoga pacifica]|uniref:GTP cyclohydrolase FolE2 n=1 Tax=Kosmotoga pacifica TaxID=1330330 RepID=A0A0G2Z681_9BACT|nr:GTP cyclohydrolase FolE2 [Kosmotoga pacifica]AKI97115.1 GTP cyclohydrolase [Kosmotoga pacifica]